MTSSRMRSVYIARCGTRRDKVLPHGCCCTLTSGSYNKLYNALGSRTGQGHYDVGARAWLPVPVHAVRWKNCHLSRETSDAI